MEHERYDGFRPANVLKLTPLKPECDKVGKRIIAFLYSTTSTAFYDG